MTSSTSATTSTPQPEFRNNDVVPDYYLVNVAIFFIVFITVSAIVFWVLKNKFPSAFSKVNARETQLVKHSQRLSATTRLHVVAYNNSTFLIVESSNNITVQEVASAGEQNVIVRAKQETPDGR